MAFARSKQVIISVLFGTFDAGGVATFASGSGLSFQCIATDFSISKNVKTVDTRALCEDAEAHVPVSIGGTIDFTARVPADGSRTFKEKDGLPVRVSVQESAAATTPQIYAGIVSGVSHAGSIDDMQSEKVTITLGLRIGS